MLLFGYSVHTGLLNVGRMLCVQPHWTITFFGPWLMQSMHGVGIYLKKTDCSPEGQHWRCDREEAGKIWSGQIPQTNYSQKSELDWKVSQTWFGTTCKDSWYRLTLSERIDTCVCTCLVFQSGRWFCLWRPTDTCCGRLPVSISIHSIDWPHQKQTQHAEIIATLAAELKKDHHPVCSLWH